MAAIATSMDYLIKEYLTFRGFTNTFKSYEAEIKVDNNKSFRVESIVDHFALCINNYDIVSLRKYWKYFDSSYFNQLGHDSSKIVKKLESDLLKLYIVHAVQSNRMDKVNEFFEKYALDLQTEDSWKCWFVIPFMKNPEQTRQFSIYFAKIWQDSVMLSLGNCLDTIFCNLELPSLINFEKEKRKMDKLDEENIKLKEQLAIHQKELIQLHHQMRAGKVTTSTQTIDFNHIDGDTAPRGKKKSPTTKAKFGGWKFLNKDKDKDNTKSTNKEMTSKEDKLPKKYLDESGIRKLLNKSNVKTDNNKSASFEESTNNSGLGVEENNAENEQLNPSLFYIPLPQNEINEYIETPTPGAIPLPTDGSNDDSRVKEALEKPFLVLSQDEFTEHTSSVTSCKFSENSNTVASLDISGTVKIWQCHPSFTSSTLTLKGDYSSLDWIPKLDGKLMLGKSTGQLCLYDTLQKKNLWEAYTHPKFKRVNCIASSPISVTAVCSVVATYNDQKKSSLSQQRLIKMKQYSSHNNPSNSKEGSLSLWDLHTGQRKNDLSLDPYPVCLHSLSYNHNGTLVVTGGADGMIRLFDIRNSDCIIGWHAHSVNVLDVKFHPNETCIYSMGADGKLCVWDVNKVSSKIAEFPLHYGSTGIYHYNNMTSLHNDDEIPNSDLIGCDSDGQHMMTCSPSGLMIYRVMPTTVMEELMHVVCPCSEVLTLDWNSSPNCSMAMCGTKKGTVQISTLMKN